MPDLSTTGQAVRTNRRVFAVKAGYTLWYNSWANKQNVDLNHTDFYLSDRMKTRAYRITALLLFTIWLNPVYGQSRFSVSATLAPVYTHLDSKAIIPDLDPTSVSGADVQINKVHGFAYSIGLLGTYKLSPKWSASAGVWAVHFFATTQHYSVNQFQYDFKYRNGRIFQYAYRLPFMINFQPSTRRLSPYLSAGASLNFRSLGFIDVSGVDEPGKFGKSTSFTPILGLGISYRLPKNLTFIAQPMCQYNLQSHPPYTYYHLYQVSLQTQLRYHF